MDEAEQARAYALADYSGPHQAFVERFAERFPGVTDGDWVDLGCGPADVTERFARAFPRSRLLGVDGSQAMLAEGRLRLSSSDLVERIELRLMRLPTTELDGRRFEAVISNSLLHHLPEPKVLWDTVRAVARSGAAIAVMDLLRPPDRTTAEEFVARYAGDAPVILRRDFLASLLAAYRVDEVESQLADAGLGRLNVEVVSDRHLLVWGLAP